MSSSSTIKRFLKTLGSAVLFFVVAALLIGQVFAYTVTQSTVDDREDFVMEPAKQEVLLDPSQTDTRSIYITSRIKEPTTFKVEIEDIIGSQNADQPVLLLGGDRSPYSLKDYLEPEIKQFTLNFGQKIQIPVKINLPPNAAPGGFYAAVIVSNAPSKEATSTTGSARAKTISRLGSLFLVRINGPVNQSGHLTDFKIKEKGPVFQKADLTFQIYFKNEGTVHLVPFGNIEVKNMWGQKIADLPVDAYFSLPQSLRYREVRWTSPLALGRYTATLHLHRGYGDTIDEKSFSFWIIPWKVLLIALIVILILVTLIYFFVRNFELKRK